jgi:hypothetical protein
MQRRPNLILFVAGKTPPIAADCFGAVGCRLDGASKSVNIRWPISQHRIADKMKHFATAVVDHLDRPSIRKIEKARNFLEPFISAPRKLFNKSCIARDVDEHHRGRELDSGGTVPARVKSGEHLHGKETLKHSADLRRRNRLTGRQCHRLTWHEQPPLHQERSVSRRA